MREKNREQWDEFVSKGIVEQVLIEALLRCLVEPSNIPVVVKIMQKYELIVSFDHPLQLPFHSNSTKYLVPTFLPLKGDDPWSSSDDLWGHVQCFNSCYFAFTTRKDVFQLKSAFNLSQLKNDCFLPCGLMERLLCKAVRSAKMNQEPLLYKNYAIFACGSQLVRIVCIPKINCIRLDVEGETPIPVCDRIYELVNKCVKDHTESLHVIKTLRLGSASESQDGFVLLNLEAVRDAYLNGRSLIVKNYPPLDHQYFCDAYGSWLNVSCDSVDNIASDRIETEYRASLIDCSVPCSMQEEWNWFANCFCDDEMNQKYFQKYAILNNRRLSE